MRASDDFAAWLFGPKRGVWVDLCEECGKSFARVLCQTPRAHVCSACCNASTFWRRKREGFITLPKKGLQCQSA